MLESTRGVVGRAGQSAGRDPLLHGNRGVWELPGRVRFRGGSPHATAELRRPEALVGMGVIVPGPGESVDFASRYFAPSCGIEEDPVTGSIHCTLVPYWADRLGKKEFHARQVSARSGDLFCELLDGRVSIAGRAVLFMEGYIEV